MAEETEGGQLFTLIIRSLDEQGRNMEVKLSGMTEEKAQQSMATGEAEDALRSSHYGFFGEHPTYIGIGMFPYVEDIDGPIGRTEETGV